MLGQFRTDCKRAREDEHNEHGKRMKHEDCCTIEWDDIPAFAMPQSSDLDDGFFPSNETSVKRQEDELSTRENNGMEFSEMSLHQQLIDANANGRSIRVQGVDLAQPQFQCYPNMDNCIPSIPPFAEPEKPLLLEWHPSPHKDSSAHRTRKRSFNQEDAISFPKKLKSHSGWEN